MELHRFAACLLSALVVACSAAGSCPDEQPRRSVDSGATDLESVVYESAPFTGPLEPFPALSELWFHHGLGFQPLNVSIYLSFDRAGTSGSDVTPGAGDAALITCVGSQAIRVRNNTCERHFFIRVVAEGKSLAQTESTCAD